MWTRGLLKQNAWNQLKGYYWTAVGVSTLGGLITGALSFELKLDENEVQDPVAALREKMSDFLPAQMTHDQFVTLLITLSIISVITSLLYTFFIANPVTCGKDRYFVRARGGDSDFGNLFYYFKSGRYLNSVKVMFRRDLSVFLWTLALIVPGIIKAFEYALVPYLLADNPKLSKERAFEISRKTMDGEKLNYFVLNLSFIGWYLLGALCCGVGLFFVMPYPEATIAEFYTCMKAKMFSLGIASEYELQDPDAPAPPTGGWNGGVPQQQFMQENDFYPGQAGDPDFYRKQGSQNGDSYNPYDFQ